MPTLKTINISSKQATICIIGLLELVFLLLLVYAYQFSGSADLKNIIKDVFLGWNTALALALNTTNSSKPDTTVAPAPPVQTVPVPALPPPPPPFQSASLPVNTQVPIPVVNTAASVAPKVYN